MKYTFEELPQAISTLHEKVDRIKDLLLENKSQNPQRPREDLLTIGQAAEFLNLSVPTLYTKVSRKEIPVNKRGKRLYFSMVELSDWVRSGRKKTTEEIRQGTIHSATDGIIPPPT
ncbi:excisionase family DNA binding protein [Pedobacter cryoconitis]|uniref:Excisionase family DNA binding protein n=1 Tax=Pedobacter cryoconitis TaxID=188932 RepID=A0A7W9E241_9SPHI|nr:helix-turn-helix domain-containing protein [Pedobacter cryoconitis]MBB5638919.1 excisionase family DNA binding protein [Pedobacter cryoconitis]